MKTDHTNKHGMRQNRSTNFEPMGMSEVPQEQPTHNRATKAINYGYSTTKNAHNAGQVNSAPNERNMKVIEKSDRSS